MYSDADVQFPQARTFCLEIVDSFCPFFRQTEAPLWAKHHFISSRRLRMLCQSRSKRSNLPSCTHLYTSGSSVRRISGPADPSGLTRIPTCPLSNRACPRYWANQYADALSSAQTSSPMRCSCGLETMLSRQAWNERPG